MKIKRIEIIGFKSFCDRSVINIDHDITAVVGPNGCGKSNIVDAIRWTMGEQSAKHLRGKAMDDVIFAGSDGRGPATMAEVTLTFDDVTPTRWLKPELDDSSASENEQTESDADTDEPDDSTASAGEEPAKPAEPSDEDVFDILAEPPPAVDFSQFTEVAVTRRLFRDGTSQYMINRIPCRLRDVQDFFMGSGVGTKAYAVIEQGRVGQIVSSRPGDRRLVIEEAAGITKFKSRRRAATRRLDSTRQNLARVSDILTELDARQGQLKRQAQKAERYRRYRNELRELELWQASCDYLRIRCSSRAGETALTASQERLAADRTVIEQLDTQCVQLRDQRAVADQELSGLRERLYEAENKCKLAANRAEFRDKEITEIAARIDVAQQSLDELFSDHRDKEAAVVEQRRGLVNLGEEYQTARGQLDERRGLTESLRVDLSGFESQLDAAKEKSRELAESEARKTARLEEYERDHENCVAELAQKQEQTNVAQTQLRKLTEEANRHESQLATLKQTKFDLGNELEALLARKHELSDERKQLAESLRQLQVALAEKKSRLASLSEIQKRYEGMLGGTRFVMSAREGNPIEGVRGLLAEAINVPADYETAIEAALGTVISAVIVDSDHTASSAIEMLRANDAGEAVFVPASGRENSRSLPPQDQAVIGLADDLVSTAPGMEFLARTVLANTLVVKTTQDAIRLSRQFDGRVASLEGDVVDAAGIIWGCHDKGRHAGILARKREIEELAASVQDLHEKQALLEGQSRQSQERLVQIEKAVEAKKRAAHESEVAIVSADKDAAKARADRDAARNSLVQLDAARLTLQERQTSIAEATTALRRELQEISDDKQRLAGREQHLSGVIGEAQRQLNEASEQLTALEVRVATLAEKQSAVESAAVQLTRSVSESEKRLATLRESLEKDRARLTGLKEEAATDSDSMTALESERSTLSEAVTQGGSGLEEIVGALAKAEDELRTVRQRVEATQEDVRQREVALANGATDLRVLAQTILDKHNVTIESILFDYHKRPQPSDDEVDRIDELRRLLRRMGDAVNLTAIEEYQEVSERFEYLSAQRDDLERAVSQLEKAIDKINRTSRRIFKETFDAVNAKFQELYPQLFRGGRAHLALTGSDDILEAGVEIFAQPPGKKNASVEQLSGGEKALTAVALIFSIFLIKPSPFCVLDEVDAPLDDANVDRYNEIVRSMTDRSQFIVITHNKRTMEIADTLYGVTMQVPGVSKLVNVTIARNESSAA